MRANVRAVKDMRAGAQVGARPAGDVVLEHHVDAHRLVHGAAVAHAYVREARVGAEDAILAHGAGANEMRLRPNDRVAADAGIRADPCLRGVDERDAFRHELLVDAVARDRGELGELGAAVHAQAVAVVFAAERRHAFARIAKDLEHIGQVVLVLGVVAAHFGDVRAQLGAVEGVAAGVALGDRGLFGGAVLLLDDALQHALVVEDDAAVSLRDGRHERKHRRGDVARGDRVGELLDGFGLDEGQVPVQNDDGAGGDAGRIERHAHRVRRAQALGLLDAFDGCGRICVGGVDDGANLIGVAAHNDHHALASGGERSVDDPADHGLAKNLMRDLGVVRLHTGTLASGENDRSRVHVTPKCR